MGTKTAEIPPLDLAKWPLAPIEWRPIAGLVPYLRNARTHSPGQVKIIAASMVEFGVTNPVLADAKGIVAGHGRVLAAELLAGQGVELRLPSGAAVPPGHLPVIDCTGWSAAQRKAYILTDNAAALAAGWDEELLGLELQELEEEGFDLGLIGFDSETLDSLLGTAPGAQGEGPEAARAKLAERFMLPPFSVLNAREGWWQDRKRAWIALGIQSELGRGAQANDRGQSSTARMNDAADGKKRYANAIPGGAPMPLDRAKDAKPRGRKPNATPGGV